MNLYESNNWTVIFGKWSQEFPDTALYQVKKKN